MRSLITFCWLILIQHFLLLDLNSQEKAYVSLSIGSSIPLPPFSNDDTKNQNSGLAKIGGVIHLKYVRKIPKERLGIALLLTTSVNGLNTNSIIDTYYESNPDPRLDWQRKVDGWRTISLQPGVIYTVRLSKKIDMESGIFFGIAYAKSPKYTLKGKGSGNSFGRDYYKEVMFEQDNVDGFAVTSALQSGVQCPINEKLSLSLSIAYHYLKPTFKNIEQRGSGITTFEPGGPANISIFNYMRRFNITQNMNAININGGAVYRL